MRALFLVVLAVGMVLGTSCPTFAQDEARAVIEKAVKALGGEETLRRQGARRTTIRGTFPQLNAASFTGELWAQSYDEFKHVFTVVVNSDKTTIRWVYRGGKGWTDLGGPVHDLSPAELADMKRGAYHDRVTDLVPLLKDRAFTLKALQPDKLDGREMLPVRVSSPGQPDITLWFDRATGLLAKSEWRIKKEGGKEVTSGTTYDDYREVDPAAAAERALKEAKVATDSAGLLAFLRRQGRSEAERDKVRALIKQLGDEDFMARKKASEELVRLGGVALPQLRQVVRDEKQDEEVRRRARECLSKLEALKVEEFKVSEDALLAALHLVALRKPEGAAEVLLALAPSLTDETLTLELRSALAAVAVRNGKPDRAVEQALTDKDPARRAAAAAALGRDGGAFQRQPGRRVFLGGLKYPHKLAQYEDGVKQAEWEVLDVQHYNKLEERLFAKPD